MLTFLLAAALSLPGRSPADYAILQGRVIITTRTPEAVVIGVDENNDGYADDLFWFFASPAPPVNVYSEKASIEFRGEELVVISGESGELYGFSVGRSRIAQRGLSSISSSTVYSGYGLNHMMGPSVNRIRMPWPHKGRLRANDDDCTTGCIYNIDPGGDASGSGGCSSGGPGSSSCSVTSTDGSGCSVSCLTGYYACCNYSTVLRNPSCQCIKY